MVLIRIWLPTFVGNLKLNHGGFILDEVDLPIQWDFDRSVSSSATDVIDHERNKTPTNLCTCYVVLWRTAGVGEGKFVKSHFKCHLAAKGTSNVS